ncbi:MULTISPECIES: winged helix-turn-helix transcriptional regulator [Kordiimonas]|uniref:winged helix-turn-helix transcriptional regulator n=1 Tax=Kordiimonas TaxID=288021 RepID=UPI00257A81AA|nr:helix-turn-helix domain-containing protein [Kordiimonas sp. UBA4487]
MPSRLRKTPLPGRPVKGSKTGRPIMAALDLLGRRWALRIVWELRDGPVGFRAMQARCDGMSPSVLSTRLKELHEARLIEPTEDQQWQLTALGTDLNQTIAPLNDWSEGWKDAF